MSPSSPLLLSLDSSTPCGSVALTRGTSVLAEICLNEDKTSHSDYLLRYIDLLLSEIGSTCRDLDAMAVVAGPGSFTGLRVGIATVQGLALALGLSVYPVSSLQAVAFSNGQSPLPVYALIDARKKQVYAARYLWVPNGLSLRKRLSMKLKKKLCLLVMVRLFMRINFSKLWGIM